MSYGSVGATRSYGREHNDPGDNVFRQVGVGGFAEVGVTSHTSTFQLGGVRATASIFF